MSNPVVLNTDLKDLKLVNKGKVRDIYDCGDKLLIITTDRISAFDVILPEGIPLKGKVLSQTSAFWFEIMKDTIPHHLISMDMGIFHLSAKNTSPVSPEEPC